MNKYQFNPDIAIPPGETIKELAEHDGVTIAQLMWGLGLQLYDVASLLSGDYPIDVELAEKLGYLFEGYSASFWINLEENYQKRLRRMTND